MKNYALQTALSTLLLAGVLPALALGVRCFIHDESPYYPMVRWYDLNVLWPIVIAAVAGFHISMFLTLRWQIVNTGVNSKHRNLLIMILMGLGALGLAASIFMMGATHQIPSSITNPPLILCGYVAILAFVLLIASFHCHRHMEIAA